MVATGVGRVYVDASALVKTIVREAETDALVAYLSAPRSQVSSRVIAVEVARAVARADRRLVDRGDEALRMVDFIELNEAIATVASSLEPRTLRTLDAVHLASAIYVSTEIDALLTYDRRLANAARAAGLTVVAPA